MNSIELEAAVESGVITSDVADHLRNFSAKRRGTPLADEEHFGTVSGFSDVMSAVGLILLIGGAGILLTATGFLEGFIIAAVAWLLSEYFTRIKRLTLTSYLLFATFAISCAMAALGAAALGHLLQFHGPAGAGGLPAALGPLPAIVVALGTAAACFGYWARFQLPIAYTAGAIAGINGFIHIMRLIAPATPSSLVSVILLGFGVLLFLLAMWWDLSDIRRETRRSDIAFWLHMAAGFQIAGASYRLLFGVTGAPTGWDRLYSFATRPPDTTIALIALALFVAFAMVALAVDRRSLLMSSLSFVILALARIASEIGPSAPIVAATVMGAALLGIAVFWRRLRITILARLPSALRAQLPRTEIVFTRRRPVT